MFMDTFTKFFVDGLCHCIIILCVLLSSTILVIIFWNIIMFQFRPDSQQVKRNLISDITNLVYEVPHKLQNDP